MGITRRAFLKASLIFGGSLVFTRQAVAAARKPADTFVPAYVKLHRDGTLAERIEQAAAVFEECRLCPRECGVDRLAGETGFCRATSRLV